MGDRVRIEIGFDGGQVMGGSVEAATVDALEQAIGSGHEGSFAVEVDDGRYTIAVSRVVYVKRFSREGRVGFGT